MNRFIKNLRIDKLLTKHFSPDKALWLLRLCDFGADQHIHYAGELSTD